MDEVTRRSYPIISAKNWWDLRRRFQRSIPDRVDAQFLQSVLGVGEGDAKNLIRQLVGVGFINESSTPTELAIRWQDNAGYSAACQRILMQIYPQALRDASPPPAPDRTAVEQWFERNANVDKAVATKMASFYSLVAAADPMGWRQGSKKAEDVSPEAAPPRSEPSTATGAPREATKAEPAHTAFGATAVPVRTEMPEVRPFPVTPSREPDFAQARNRYLTRRWRVIALSMLVGGIAAFGFAASRQDVYIAQAAVVATDSGVTAEQVGPVAETVFSTDAVLQPVIDRLELRATPASLLATGALDAKSLSGGPALLISGRSSDPRLAVDLANAATESFVTVAGQKGLGTFARFESIGPATPQPHETGLLVALGILAGGGVALLVLATVFFLRDPVTSEEDARREFSPDAAFRLRVSARRAPTEGEEEERNQEDAAFDVWPSGVFSSLWETVHDRAQRDGRGACAVIVVGSDSDWAAAAVARKLEARAQGHGSGQGPSDGFSISSSDRRLPEMLGARDTVVAIVPSGAPRRSLRHLGEELRALGARFQVLVLVDPRR